MKFLFPLLMLGSVCVSMIAQKPRIKVDINMEGRRESEVNEPGYTPWYVNRVHMESLTESGITFTLKATAPANEATFRTSWSKALVQSPHYMRLVNDGVQIDNDVLLAHPGTGASMELHISGLPAGLHNLQTYHNVWQDTADKSFCPINIYVGDSLVHREVKRSVQVKNTSDATILLTGLKVTEEGQVPVLRIEAVEEFTASAGKAKNFNVNINAFELNTIDVSRQAREPMPADLDMHVNADSGFFDLRWMPALKGNIQNHVLYFGTDSAEIAFAADSSAPGYKGVFPLGDTMYRVDGLYSMNTYYWRVDEVDSLGETTEGRIWSFRPRHLAFRGAEGYGRFATGGRGGKVVEVTNLNDNGPGSFREAVTKNIGPRTIVFRVSGMITLNSRISISDKYITIAGQTAPGRGICFRNASVGLGSESITRFIRVRLGAGEASDGMGLAGCNHSIIDHCSVSWTIDEAFSSRNGRNITLQRTLISEALNVADHPNYPPGSAHGYAASIGGDVGSFHHNLLAHCSGRNWSLAGGLDGDGYYAGRLDIFNNVVYNWSSRTTDGGAHEVNFFNNYYKKGASSANSYILTAQLEGLGKGSQSYYYSGNIMQNTGGEYACDGTNNTCGRKLEVAPAQTVDWQVFVDQPFFPSHANIETARDAYKSVLSDVGCTLPQLDHHDKRIVHETLTGTYTYRGSITGLAGLIDHQDDAGGYENYPELSRPEDFDSDHDGLPNWWEDLHESDPLSAEGDFSDSNADPDGDGYTALEDYLEWMSVPHFYLEEGVRDTIDLSGFFAGYVNPVYSCGPAQNYNVSIADADLIIQPGPDAYGITFLQISAVDSEGSLVVRNMGVCVGAENQIGTGAEERNRQLSFEKEFSCIVYPGLFENQLNLEISSGRYFAVVVVLYELTGKPVLSDTFEIQPGKNYRRLEFTDSLSRGVYLLRVTDKNSSEVLEVVRVIKL